MCCIAGCFGIQDEKTVDRMLDAMTHRGPDDRGIHVHRSLVRSGQNEKTYQCSRVGG